MKNTFLNNIAKAIFILKFISNYIKEPTINYFYSKYTQALVNRGKETLKQTEAKLSKLKEQIIARKRVQAKLNLDQSEYLLFLYLSEFEDKDNSVTIVKSIISKIKPLLFKIGV